MKSNNVCAIIWVFAIFSGSATALPATTPTATSTISRALCPNDTVVTVVEEDRGDANHKPLQENLARLREMKIGKTQDRRCYFADAEKDCARRTTLARKLRELLHRELLRPRPNVCRPGRRARIIDPARPFPRSPHHRNRLPRIDLGAGHISLPHPAAASSLISVATVCRRRSIRAIPKNLRGAIVLIRLWPGLVTALQNRVMKIGGMRLTRIKCDDDALMREIHHHILHPVDFHQDGAQLTHALIAIFAFSCNLDGFQDRVISPLGIKWIAGSGSLGRAGSIVSLSNVRGRLCGCVACDRLENAPDILSQNSLPNGVRMNAIGQVQ